MHTSRMLFDEVVEGLDGGALFKSASELARELISSGLYSGNSTEKSLASYLGQILSNNRNCPDDIRVAIPKIVAKRLDVAKPMSSVERSAIIKRVQNALKMDELTRLNLPMLSEQLFYELLELTEKASELFIITARASEEVLSPQAEMLNEMLLRRTGLLELVQEGSDKEYSAVISGEDSVRYIFNFPSVILGHRWWQLLFESIMRHVAVDLDDDEIHKVVKQLQEKGHLQAHAIPSFACGCPTVVFEPRTQTPTGFNLYYHPSATDKNLVSLARMDNSSLRLWKDYVFKYIGSDDSGGVEAVPYDPGKWEA